MGYCSHNPAIQCSADGDCCPSRRLLRDSFPRDNHHQLDRHLAACSDFNGLKRECEAAGTGTECTYDNPSKLCTGDLNPAPTTAQPTTANPTPLPTTANPTPPPTTANPTSQPTNAVRSYFFV